MEIFDNIDIYPKIIVALTGLIAAFIKIRDTYSSTKTKQNIKLDLEIYELLNRNGDFDKKKLLKKTEPNYHWIKDFNPTSKQDSIRFSF